MKIIIPHLRDNDVSYFEHMRRALSWSARLAAANAALSIHAFLPFAFTKTASDTIVEICKEMKGPTCT
jgi:hypothetical protein